MNAFPPALLLALGLAIIVIIIGIVVFIVLRRRRPSDGAVPLQDLPVESEATSLDDDRFAPPDAGDLAVAPVRDIEPVAEPQDDRDAELVRDARDSFDAALQPTSQSVAASSGNAPLATVTFRLFLPTQGHARSAGQIARRDGYTADVQPPANGETMWVCVLTREMAASPAAIGEEMTILAELAGSFGGRVER